MPSYMDSDVARATATLKEAQVKLTNLRWEHLERGFARIDEIKAAVAEAAGDIRAAVTELPAVARRAMPDVIDPTCNNASRVLRWTWFHCQRDRKPELP